MTACAPTIEFHAEVAYALPVKAATARPIPEKTRNLQQRLEAGLDRLLADIERFEETERWDGLS